MGLDCPGGESHKRLLAEQPESELTKLSVPGLPEMTHRPSTLGVDVHCARAGTSRAGTLCGRPMTKPPREMLASTNGVRWRPRPRNKLTSFAFDTMEDALDAFSRGEFLVVMDDEDRENEGDLIIAAVHCTTEKMAWMIKHTRCVSLSLMQRRLSQLSQWICLYRLTWRTTGTAGHPYDGPEQRGSIADSIYGDCRLQAWCVSECQMAFDVLTVYREQERQREYRLMTVR